MGATRDESSKEQVKMSPPAKITLADFSKRARHYRFAVALTDTPRDAVTFDGLAAMFDQIACRFRRAEMRLARLQSSTLPPSQPHQKAQQPDRRRTHAPRSR
jgi:hypothetical protein